VKIARAAIEEYEHLERAVDKFPKPVVRPMLRSITARPAIPVTGLGLVALARVYFLGVGPRAEFRLRGETTRPIVSTNVAQKRDTAVSTAPLRQTDSASAALRKGNRSTSLVLFPTKRQCSANAVFISSERQ
jgi:hypothetical protein